MDMAMVTKEKGMKLWVFPEGTRNHGDGFLEFKKGAFHLAVQGQIPIVPLVISSYESFYSKPGRRFDLGGHVIVEALAPIPTKGLSADDVPELTAKTRQSMLRVFENLRPEAASLNVRKKSQ